MAKKTPNKAVTKNVRIYGDSHEMIKDHAEATHQTIAGLIHQFALSLKAGKLLQ